ncbi:MAG: MBL fold metallo-hydrolase [Chitinophagales bacterium]
MVTQQEIESVLSIRMNRKFFNREVSHVYVYFTGGLLINTGITTGASEISQALEGKSLKLIVNTHYHRDVIGNNALLQQKYSVPVKAHKDSLENIRHPHEISLLGRGRKLLPSKASKLRNTLRVGDLNFRVIETPGFQPGHVCLFEQDKRLLFTGDLLAQQEKTSGRSEEYLKDLQKVLSLEPAATFCSRHGFLENGLEVMESRLRSNRGKSARTYPDRREAEC